MTEPMQYKGFTGSVEYSVEDQLFHGRLLGLRDMVSFEGEDLDSLEKSFHATVEADRARSAEWIAEIADAGEDISRFFTGNGRMVRPRG